MAQNKVNGPGPLRIALNLRGPWKAKDLLALSSSQSCCYSTKVLWDVTSCRLVNSHRLLESEDKGFAFFRKVHKHLTAHTAKRPRRRVFGEEVVYRLSHHHLPQKDSVRRNQQRWKKLRNNLISRRHYVIIIINSAINSDVKTLHGLTHLVCYLTTFAQLSRSCNDKRNGKMNILEEQIVISEEDCRKLLEERYFLNSK
jgi:hypothetical protein